MSFGRLKNVVRRAERPDGRFHRDKRRSHVDHPLAIPTTRPRSLLLTVLSLPIRLIAILCGR